MLLTRSHSGWGRAGIMFGFQISGFAGSQVSKSGPGRAGPGLCTGLSWLAAAMVPGALFVIYDSRGDLMPAIPNRVNGAQCTMKEHSKYIYIRFCIFSAHGKIGLKWHYMGSVFFPC